MVYLIKAARYYKIGVSEHPKKRLAGISTGCPVKPELISVCRCEDDYRLEKALHLKYLPLKSNGEWFQLDEERVKEILEVFSSERKKSKIIREKIADERKANRSRTSIKVETFTKEEAITFIRKTSNKGCKKKWCIEKGLLFPPKKGWKKNSDKILAAHFGLNIDQLRSKRLQSISNSKESRKVDWQKMIKENGGEVVGHTKHYFTAIFDWTKIDFWPSTGKWREWESMEFRGGFRVKASEGMEKLEKYILSVQKRELEMQELDTKFWQS